MTKLKGVVSTLKTTKNFWTAFFLKISHGERTIVFRNGVQLRVNWTKYCRLRDWFANQRDEMFNIKQVSEGYLISDKDNSFTLFFRSLDFGHSFFKLSSKLLSHGWAIKQISDGLFHFKNGDVEYIVNQLSSSDLFNVKSNRIELVAPLDSLWAYFCECEAGMYDYDFNDKVVLDIGGFCGETAVFFASRGAKKVVIYEPVLDHRELIRNNISLNNFEAELHEEGIGEQDGVVLIRFEDSNLGFGLHSKGKNQAKIKVKNVAKVIEESNADIAKFDCEGAEISLISLPQETLRRINFYIIETHTSEIQKEITAKFKNAGFRIMRNPQKLNDNISLLYFEKTL